MKDDDPEQRIRELEGGLADPTPPVTGAPSYGFGFTPPARRAGVRWPLLAVFALAILVPIVMAMVWAVSMVRNSPAIPNSGGTTVAVPITMEHGGTLSAGGNGTNDSFGCNDGYLTLNANNSTVKVTGHCASLQIRGFDNHVNVESADLIEVSGFGNTIAENACNNGTLSFVSYGNTFSTHGRCASLKLANYNNRVQADSIDTIVVSSYGNKISVTGHCGSLTVSAYNNQAQCDSVDTVNLSDYGNTVTYHTGSPKVTDKGRRNTVQQG